MADTSRFPQLAYPFALAGAAGGWLSAGLVANPLVQRATPGTQGVATLVAALSAAMTGALITRLCIGEEQRSSLDDLTPGAQARTPRWLIHAAAVLAAGAATGGLVALVCRAYNGPLIGALGGLVCGTLFLPVCFAVIAAAQRARRARHGSFVADSDRRAVWGILAMALAVATLEALPDWPAAAAFAVPVPRSAVGLLAITGLMITAVLIADAWALRRAKQAIAPGLVPHDPGETAPADSTVPTLDLGLGDEVAARVARSAAAYRGRHRTLALVQGDSEQALTALRRALRRGGVGLALVGLLAGVHAATAHSDSARLLYDERRCDAYEIESCARAAETLRDENPMRAVKYYERACSALSVESCLALGEIYDTYDPDKADEYFGIACKHKSRRGCLHFSH